MINRISSFIAKHPKTILLIASLLLIPAAIGYISTFVNYDIMSYMPASVESVQGEQLLDKDFDLAANAFLVITDMKSKDVVKIKNSIAEIEGVNNVIWVDDVMDINIPQSMLPDSVTEIFYSTDKSSTLVMVQFDQGSASTLTMNAIKEIKSLLNKQCFLSGMSAIIEDTKELTDSEAPFYIAVAIILALIALSFTMDSWLLPFVLITALGYAVVYNMGTNFFMPKGISYITQSIAAILQLGVTMDYSVFLMDRFNEELETGDDRTAAMSRAITSTFQSLIGSSLTTVFGFIALCFMSFTLGFDIGIVMAKGVLLGVLTVVIVLPTFLLIFYKPINKLKHKRIIPNFSKLNGFLIKHRKVFAIIFFVLIIPSFIAKSIVPLDYCIANALPEQLDSVQALAKLKGDFNMATTHFVIIDEDVPSGKVSEMISEFEKVDGISTVISLNSFVGPTISESMLPDEIKEICIKGGHQLMMMNSVYEASSDEQNAQIETLTEILKRYDPTGYLTGEGVLSKDLIAITNVDFKVTNAISIAAIFVLIMIIFKSISIPVLLVLSIELAIFINGAFPLVTGADVSFIAPTVISCVQLGATVDYAILLTTRFREELRKGTDKKTAMHIAANASDKSIFQSALVFFCATFGVYLVCNVEIVSSLCAMLARGAIISALVIVLFLTPLLTSFDGFIDKTTMEWKKIKDKTAKTKGGKKAVKASSVLKKATAISMVLAMLLCMVSCSKKTEQKPEETTAGSTAPKVQQVYSQAPSAVTKAETVFVNLKRDGSKDSVSVTDWIHTDKGEVRVNDLSDLNDIYNIKSDIEPIINGENIIWDMPETDIYYGGTTDKQPIVDFEIKYYLDGKEISGDELAGKSGKVKIEINMKNNVEKTVKMNGKDQKIFLPVMVVGGMIMPEADFSGITVENGRAIGDGTKEIVVFFGMPGMSESLGLDDIGVKDMGGLVMGNTASVTAETGSFNLGNMYFAALPIGSMDLDLQMGDSMDDVKSIISVLKNFQDTIGTMDTKKLMSIFTSDVNGLKNLTGVLSSVVSLYNDNKALIKVVSKYSDPESVEQLKKLLTFLGDEKNQRAISTLLNSDILSVLTGLSELRDTAPLLASLAAELQTPEVKAAIDRLPETLKQLSEIQAVLDKNSSTINTLLDFISGKGGDSLSTLLSLLQKTDISSIAEKYSALTGNADVLLERCEKWMEAGRTFKIFTKATDEMSTSVTFIYQTPSIKVKVETEPNTAEQSGESPLDSFIKKFR
ncbi:MAG: MMPL family transporter [Clostridiales bacterium]|nr:MMPL family transporter [Clostridiales bacterium]